MSSTEDNGVKVETTDNVHHHFEDPLGVFDGYGEYDDRYFDEEEDWCDEEDRPREEDSMGIFAGYGEFDDHYFAEPPMCKWEDGDDFRDEWLYGDDFPTPARFAGLEVPPPKTRCTINFAEEIKTSRNRLWRKRCLGKNPRYKCKRQGKRFSTILHAHVELTREEWFLYDQMNAQEQSFRDRMEDENESFDEDMRSLNQDLATIQQMIAEMWADRIPRWLIELQTEIEIKMYERQQEFNERYQMAA